MFFIGASPLSFEICYWMTAFWPVLGLALPAVLPVIHHDCEMEFAKLLRERQALFPGLSHIFWRHKNICSKNAQKVGRE
ncbi:MAG: hypothetical protein CSH37_06610 [Thalassolituus sp.]|nr:MAG: hypothetical protein CSH37_06610 [Thalassolituus sp.]